MLMDAFKKITDTTMIKNRLSFVNNPCDDTASEFLLNYFESHSKSLLFNMNFTDQDTMFSKSLHTVSMFLLGITLKQLIAKTIEKSISINAPLELSRFDYPWLLSCLYHDVFADYEKNHTSEYPYTLPEFIEKGKIEHTIYDINLPNEINISKFYPIYKEETVENYYEDRIKSGRIDHGIISGYYAFDRLTKNYINNWEQNGKEKQFCTQKDNHTLIWDNNQIWVFALVADAIVVHNIWHTEKMKSVSMELYPNAENKAEVKLGITKTPLAYFLSLMDTIEPYKFFSNNTSNPHDILDNLSIDLHNNEITIKKSESFKYDFENWFEEKMKNMSDWLEGTCAKKTDGSTITITLPSNEDYAN